MSVSPCAPQKRDPATPDMVATTAAKLWRAWRVLALLKITTVLLTDALRFVLVSIALAALPGRREADGEPQEHGIGAELSVSGRRTLSTQPRPLAFAP